ncbi:MAG: GNAT family protein [bacterium]
MGIIQGKKILLRSATGNDKRIIYEWMAHSDTTSSHMGPPDFPDNPIPTYEQFCLDYKAYFFNGTEPKLGRCFMIIVDNNPVGQINYDKIDENNKRTELDIWMNCRANCGRGYGADALKTLCDYLFKKYGILEFVVRPSARNHQAVRFYEKMGFHRIKITDEQQKIEFGRGDYSDSIVLIKKNSRNQ